MRTVLEMSSINKYVCPQECMWLADKYGLPKPVCLQHNYSLLKRDLDWEIIPIAKRFNISIISWSPLQVFSLFRNFPHRPYASFVVYFLSNYLGNKRAQMRQGGEE